MESNDPVANLPVRSKLAEFRRWLMIAFALPIAGTCLGIGFDKFAKGPYLIHAFFVILFAVASGCEGWLQFDRWPRRVFWALGGLVTGIFIGSRIHFESRLSYTAVFGLPAVIELATAYGARNRPWIWLVTTVTLYGCMPIWGEPVGSAARKVVTYVSEFAGYPTVVQSSYAGFTSIIAAILITRAFVGSFIASRKQI